MSWTLLILYSIVITSAICMLLTNNPATATLFLMLTYIGTSFIFMSVGADFIGILILIIYVGAIATLFLFIVMMISIKRATRDVLSYLAIGGIFLAILGIQLFYVVYSTSIGYVSQHSTMNNNTLQFIGANRIDETSRKNAAINIGIALVYEYPVLLLAVGLLLFISIIACIALINIKSGTRARRQYNQFVRNTRHLNVFCRYDYD